MELDLVPKNFQAKIISRVFEKIYKRILLRVYRQCGKSWLFAYLACAWAGLNPGSIIIIMTPTMTQGLDVYWRDRTKLFGMLDPEEIFRSSEKNAQITLKNGSVIMLRGVDNIENRRGLTADLLLCDEVAYFPKGTYVTALAPLTRARGGITLFASTPLDEKGNEFYDLEQQMTHGAWSEDSYVLHMGVENDPDLSPGEKEQIKNDYSGSPLAYKREGLAEYAAMQGKKFPSFSSDIHVIDYNDFKLDPEKPILLGIDWGFNPDPNAILLCQQQRQFIYVFEEHVATNETVPTIYSKLDEILRKYQYKRIVGSADGSSPGNIATMNQLASLDKKPGFVIKGKSDVAGWDGINQSLAALQRVKQPDDTIKLQPQLRITSNCGNLIVCLSNFQDLPGNASKSEKQTNHQYSHTPDALKYIFNSGRIFVQNATGEVSARAFFRDRDSDLDPVMSHFRNSQQRDSWEGYDPASRIWDS